MLGSGTKFRVIVAITGRVPNAAPVSDMTAGVTSTSVPRPLASRLSKHQHGRGERCHNGSHGNWFGAVVQGFPWIVKLTRPNRTVPTVEPPMPTTERGISPTDWKSVLAKYTLLEREPSPVVPVKLSAAFWPAVAQAAFDGILNVVPSGMACAHTA